MQKIKEIVFNTLCYTVYYNEVIMCSLFLIFVFSMNFGV